jgi:hypothetical protein
VHIVRRRRNNGATAGIIAFVKEWLKRRILDETSDEAGHTDARAHAYYES